MTQTLKIALLCVATLSACGGGGGGGSAPIELETTPILSASITSTKSGTTPLTNGNPAVTSSSSITSSNNTTTGTTSFTLDSFGNIISAEIVDAEGDVASYSSSNGYQFIGTNYNSKEVLIAYNASTEDMLVTLFGNDASIVAEYDTVNSSTVLQKLGVVAEATSVDPSSVVSSATFSGTLMGNLSVSQPLFSPDAGGNMPAEAYLTRGKVTVAADFSAKTMNMSTDIIEMSDAHGAEYGAVGMSNLKITSSLSDTDGDNVFTGSATDAEGGVGNMKILVVNDNVSSLAGFGTISNTADGYQHAYGIIADR